MPKELVILKGKDVTFDWKDLPLKFIWDKHIYEIKKSCAIDWENLPKAKEASIEDLRVSEYSSNYNSSIRKWFHVGGEIEASYDGEIYVDIRILPTGEKVLFASKGVFENILKLFVPSPKRK